MSHKYKEYVQRCNELNIDPLPEFTPIRVNKGVVKWALIVIAIIVNMIAGVMVAINKPKR